MPYTRSESRCFSCPLRDRPRVPGGGSLTSKVAVVGESPGAEESLQGQPFVGPAGRILDAGLGAAKLPRDTVYATNLILCQPPGNDLGSMEGALAVECCAPGFKGELDWLAKQGVKVLIAAGAKPSEALGITGSISKKRGSVYEHPPFYVISTYHPSYINRMRWGKGDSRKDLEWTWVSDLAKAKGIAKEGWHPPRERFTLHPTWDEACLHLARRNELVSVDIETTSLKGGVGRVVVIGLGFSGEEGVSIPFKKHGGGGYWTPMEEIDLTYKLNEFFQGNRLMFHNALFDVPFLQAAGYEVPWDRVAHDTMLLHHVVSPEMPHSLDFIVSMYGSTPYWKEEFKTREGSILSLDDDTLRTYNLRDCVVLHQILPPLLEDAQSLGVMDVYTHESLAMLPVIAGMMEKGIHVDGKRLKAWKKHLKERYDVLERTLRFEAALPLAFNLSSDEDLRWFLYGNPPPKFKKLEALPGKRPGTKIYTELTALKSIRDDAKPIYLLRGHKGRRTDTGKVAVNKQGLLSLQVGLQNRLSDVEKMAVPRPEEVGAITKLLKWLATFGEWSEVEKLLSTYTDYPIGEDGNLHSQFLIHGTATGRLSSREVNLQNQPVKDQPLLGKCFVASEGCSLVQADYSNLEVRVLAYETGDQPLIDAVESGNVHDENTKILFNITPKDPLWKPARRAAKIFMFGGLSYGGGDREIYEKVILEAPELHLTFSRFVEAKERWMASHPAYSMWKAKVTEIATSTRRVTNAFGRVRILGGPSRDIIKEALNFPIQSAAASIINRAMVRVFSRLPMGTSLICQVHDSLLLDVPQPRVREIASLVKEEMEAPVRFHDKVVRFPVDVEVGPSWGEMSHYG